MTRLNGSCEWRGAHGDRHGQQRAGRECRLLAVGGVHSICASRPECHIGHVGRRGDAPGARRALPVARASRHHHRRAPPRHHQRGPGGHDHRGCIASRALLHCHGAQGEDEARDQADLPLHHRAGQGVMDGDDHRPGGVGRCGPGCSTGPRAEVGEPPMAGRTTSTPLGGPSLRPRRSPRR